MNNPWYKEGLRFSCTECGKCCTGAPGYVWLTEEDIAALSNALLLTREEFLHTCCRYVKGKYSLLEKTTAYDCIFLREKKCTVYEHRPRQCRTFPFWPQNLKSQQIWEQVECEGIHKEAKLVNASVIEKILNS